MAKKTLQQLLRWAKGRCYIEIFRYGSTDVTTIDELGEDKAIYTGPTLYQALKKAYDEEKK